MQTLKRAASFVLLMVVGLGVLSPGGAPQGTAYAVPADDLAGEETTHDLVGPGGAVSLSPVLPAATVTVSGTVTGPGGPVPDVWIGVNSPQGWQETITDASGFYSVTLQTGDLEFRVRPPLATRLTQANLSLTAGAADFTQNFTVTNGYLLSLQPTASGVPISGTLQFDVQPLVYLLQAEWTYILDWDGVAQRYQAVLPPDVYWINAWHLPVGYYDTLLPFDVRSADLSAAMPLNDTFVHPIPYEPPDASKITIGPVDLLGEATVTGASGAAIPLARVFLVNLNASQQSYAISEADGSFSARIYAPPGSMILVKQGPASRRWSKLYAGLESDVNPFPSTILYVPHQQPGHPGGQPFADVGGIGHFRDVSGEEPTNHVGAAWAVTGTVGPGKSFHPGDGFQVTGTLRLYGPAITATTDVGAISVTGMLSMLMQHNAQGQPIPVTNYAGATLLTPSGFAIQRPERAYVPLHETFAVTGLHYLGGNAIAGYFTTTVQLPITIPLGIYRPVVCLGFSGVPTSTDWLAAATTYAHSYEAYLPPVVVNDGTAHALQDSPRLIWYLLADDIVQGARGSAAREDQGHYALSTQIVSQGAPHYVPPVDLRTGQPIVYRLEPFLPMISYIDRGMPIPPTIPFLLPGGQMHVVIREPDGAVNDLGSEPFAQSFQRNPTTRGGSDFNPGTVRLDEIYSLKVGSDRFRVTFDQFGHHVVTMTGTISDVWGNSYIGGGTYDLWVAYPLDFDPGVLPGTPLAVGDAFNPAIQLYPRLPAEVFLTVSLYPYSDPEQVIRHTRVGQANRYGYFSADPITLTQPGEVRVDVRAVFEDPFGPWYMGTMTWGGVVMSPDGQTDLVAHGRRGTDRLAYIPPAWFVHNRDLDLPSVGTINHTLNPYFNGDLIWSRMSDSSPIGGDALVLASSVQDTVGSIEAAILTRAARMQALLEPPGTLPERVAVGELPLFISTRSGLEPQLVMGQVGGETPPDVDMVAYSYRSSQRPGVRVREVAAEDGEAGDGRGYWRLDTLYDDQFGVGLLGDQPNDFKFQYLGVVFRDLDTGHSEYLGQGTGWVYIPEDDAVGSRVMPPFAGPGNGGWTTEGGPIMILKGEEIHIFIFPAGVLPGAVLEVGDRFHFAGHIMPTLDSQVAVTVTAPSGIQHFVGGQANSIGYFYDPAGDFIVDEPGLWSVDVDVWHDGMCSGGHTVPPFPHGNVLGSTAGRYWFYVVPAGAPLLHVGKPDPIFLRFEDQVTPITITGLLPPGLGDVSVDYTIYMPGFILDHGQATLRGSSYEIVFDPVALSADFPNLDLVGRDYPDRPGLAETFAVGLLLRGQMGGETIYQANTITIQGEQVLVEPGVPPQPGSRVFLPLVQKSPIPSMTLIFSDDFEDGMLTGWTPNNGTWTNPGTYMQGESALSNAWNIRSSTGSDVLYEGTVTLLNGNAVGLVFRSSADGESSYDVILDAVDDVFKISRRPPYEILASYPMAVEYNQAYRIKVVTSGSTIDAYLDGVKLLTVTDTTYTSGNLGVMLFLGAATYDDLQAWELP